MNISHSTRLKREKVHLCRIADILGVEQRSPSQRLKHVRDARQFRVSFRQVLSIVMEANSYVVSIRRGASSASRTYTSNVGDVEPLAIAADPVIEAGTSIQAEAAAALQTLKNRPYKPKGRAPNASPGRSAGLGSLAIAGIILIAMVITAICVSR